MGKREATKNGRTRGTRAGLKWDQVVEIRSLIGREAQDDTALRFGVSQRLISRIQQGKAWRRDPATRERGEIDARRIERFWALVRKTDTCWLWCGKPEPNGYGRTFTGSRVAGTHKAWMAHRLSWTIAYGPIPPGRQVLHHCDVRLCVRPEHLFLGDHADNMLDASLKGRLGARGSNNSMAKLSEVEVLCIRKLRGVVTGRDLARLFKIHASTITQIQKGARWAHLEE